MNAEAWVHEARQSVGTAVRLLTGVGIADLDAGGRELQRAVKCMEAAGGTLRTGAGDGRRGELALALAELRRDILRARALLENAAELHRGWASVLYTAACGYTPSGEPARPQLVRRVSVEA